MLRFVGFAGGLDKQLFRLGFGAIEIERRSRRLHGFLLVAIAVDGLDVLLGSRFTSFSMRSRSSAASRLSSSASSLSMRTSSFVVVPSMSLLSICTARSTALCVLSSIPRLY